MYETGIHKYIHALIIPEIPVCDKPPVFHSAHLADLTTAFAIFCCGVFASILVYLGEYTYFRRKRVFSYFGKTKQRNSVLIGELNK